MPELTEQVSAARKGNSCSDARPATLSGLSHVYFPLRLPLASLYAVSACKLGCPLLRLERGFDFSPSRETRFVQLVARTVSVSLQLPPRTVAESKLTVERLTRFAQNSSERAE